MMEPPPFFVPGAKDHHAAWSAYLEAAGLKGDEVEALWRVTYSHDGDRYEVQVGEPRKVFRRKTGPRGGRRPNAGHRGWSSATGTVVTGIMRTPTVIFVWSEPPYGGWANPSMVGLAEIETRVRFSSADRPG